MKQQAYHILAWGLHVIRMCPLVYHILSLQLLSSDYLSSVGLGQ